MPMLPRAPRVPTWLGALGLAGVYCALGLTFQAPPLRAIAESLAWPPLGVALAGLLVLGLRAWPGVLLGAVLLPALTGATLLNLVGSALGTVGASLGAAWWLARAGLDNALRRVRDVLLLVTVGAFAAPLVHVGLTYAVAWATGSADADVLTVAFAAFRADVLGVVLAAPLVLTWTSEGATSWLRLRGREAALYMGGLLAVTYAATGEPSVRFRSAFPTRYLVFPFLFWGALRMGPSAVAAANVIVVSVSASGSWLARGVAGGDPLADRMLLLWAYCLFGSVTGLVLAANTKEREITRRQTEVIHEANTALTRSLDPGTVIDTLLTALARLVPYDEAAVVVVEDGQLVRRAHRGGPAVAAEGKPERYPLDIAWWERARQGGVVVPDVGVGPSGVGETPAGLEARSVLTVPLRAGGELIGLFALGKREPGSLTAEHLRRAESLAGQGAAAIANAGLYEQSRRDQVALRASEAKFAATFFASPDAMSLNRLSDGRYLEVNDSFLRYFDARREEVLGRTPVELSIWGDAEQARAISRHLRDVPICRNYEITLRNRAGDERTALLSADRVEVEGEPCVLVIGRDITERKRMEEALRASELLFQKAFRSSPLAMAISRLADGSYVEMNEAFTRFTGHDREEAVGRNGAELGVWEDPSQRTAMLESLRRFERISGFECRMVTKSGQKRIGLMFAETFDVGTDTHVLSAMLDVTEARRLEEQVRHAQRMEAIGRLAGGVAHDFNNMMMVIGARCELLAQEGANDGGLLPAVEEIQAVVKSAASLSRQLLTFSRKQTLRPQVVDLGDLCEQSLRMLRRLIPSNIEIRFESTSRSARVRADPSSLEQVVMNLCVNARDAMPAGGLLTLETAEVVLGTPLHVREGSLPPGRYARLRVTDTGVGMDGSTLDQIFDPFFTTKEEGKGTGLGLSVAYGVVRQSGGAILVESAPGRGAVFTVYLPVTEEPLEAAPPAPAPNAAGTETVLLVEDHDALRAVIGQYLEAAGFSVLVAEDGKAALELVQDGAARVDLLVTDVIMPGMTGRQLAETLAALHPGLRVIFLSGHPRDVISPDGTLPEWSRYLEKPYPLPELVRQIRSFLDAPRPG